jgi:hypothetical protein
MTGSIGAQPPSIITGPQGMRAVIGVTGGTFSGDRLAGTVVDGLGGDFALIRPDGNIRLDVRLVLQTNDGATIYLTYNGVGLSDGAGGFFLKTAPTFECGDERYAWLNLVQAVSHGRASGDVLTYEVFELLDR